MSACMQMKTSSTLYLNHSQAVSTEQKEPLSLLLTASYPSLDYLVIHPLMERCYLQKLDSLQATKETICSIETNFLLIHFI